MREARCSPIRVCINLKERICQEAAFEVMRVAILTAGIAHWNFAYRASEATRTFDNLCDAELRMETQQSGPTRWNTFGLIQRSERRFEIKDRAVCITSLRPLGVPEFTPVVCQIDNLPDRVAFTRDGPGRRIADGAEECYFVWNVVD